MLPSTTTPRTVGAIADEPSDAERDDALRSMFRKLNQDIAERRAAALAAEPALRRLCGVMRQKTHQGHHVRGLLYSLWNGLPYSLLEVVVCDWSVRKDIAAVILAFGFESRDGEVKFFYDAIQAAVTSAGLWDWFLEAEVTK